MIKIMEKISPFTTTDAMLFLGDVAVIVSVLGGLIVKSWSSDGDEKQ